MSIKISCLVQVNKTPKQATTTTKTTKTTKNKTKTEQKSKPTNTKSQILMMTTENLFKDNCCFICEQT